MRPGTAPFADWFGDLDVQAARKVTVALIRIRPGNLGVARSVGGGVPECKIDFGPGYRAHFGLGGETVVVLLAGGTERRQSDDVTAARARWTEYRRRRKETR